MTPEDSLTGIRDGTQKNSLPCVVVRPGSAQPKIDQVEASDILPLSEHEVGRLDVAVNYIVLVDIFDYIHLQPSWS